MQLSRQLLLLLGFQPSLEGLGGALASQRGVATTPVVKLFNVFKHVGPGLGASGVARAMNAFVLQAVEEAFGRRVVPTIALPTHRARHAPGRQLLTVGVTRVLAGFRGPNDARPQAPADDGSTPS